MKKITNKDLCELLAENNRGDWDFFFCDNVFVFQSVSYAVSIMATKGKLEDFKKVMEKIDWAKAYKYCSVPVHMKENCEWKVRKVCIYNHGKENEVRFVIPRPIEVIIEKELEKKPKTKNADDGRSGK